ncbi:MAG TPA: MarR family winged helix-turn-helix transcriptional regulator [Burkholderiales bacterium]
MDKTDDPRLLRGLLSHRVLVLSNTLALAASRYYPRRFGIRLAEWRVIDALHAGRGISANQVSQWLCTDKAWVGRSVERLISAGYVRRKPDPGHGRRLLLSLTAKGERCYAAISLAARRRHDNVLAVLSAAERDVLERTLGKLQARAAAMLARRDLGFGGPLQSLDE